MASKPTTAYNTMVAAPPVSYRQNGKSKRALSRRALYPVQRNGNPASPRTGGSTRRSSIARAVSGVRIAA
ncbi:hypothetical protein VTN96DRAFT_7444 [Rasamsonia emersonii]